MINKFKFLIHQNIDLIFRVAGLGGKFLLMLALAKTMPASVMGAFGLVTATISVCLYFVGLDFYIFSTRELLSLNRKKTVGDIIYNQGVFFILTYIILILLWSYITTYSHITAYSLIALGLVICEHLAQEIYRILIALKKNKVANFCLFLRSGAWCYILIPVIFFKQVSLSIILSTWFCFSLLSVITSIIYLKYIDCLSLGRFIPDLKWIFNGAKICAFFFIGTIAIRAMSYLDKVIALRYLNMDIIGVYVFYAGIANAIQSVIDVLVMTRFYPDVIKNVQADDTVNANETIRNFKKNNWKLNVSLYSLGYLFCLLVAYGTGKEIYLTYSFIFIFIGLSNIVLNISMPYHYWIYAKKNDGFLIWTNVLALIIFVLSAYGLFIITPQLGILAILIALITSNIFVLCRKKYFYQRIQTDECANYYK